MAENNDNSAANNLAAGGEGGNPPAEFVQAFSETNRSYFTEKGLTSEQSVVDALKAAEAYKGVDLAKMIALPTDDMKAEDYLAMMDKLGRPATVADYKVVVPEGEDPTFATDVLPMLHSAGLTKRQVDTLVPTWNKHMSDANAKANEAYNKEMGELKTEWADKFDHNIDLAKRTAAELGIPKENLVKLEKGATGSKGLWKMFYEISKRTSDGTIKGAGAGVNKTTVNYANPAEADAKIKELMASKEFATKMAAGDPEATKLFNDLHAAKYGDRTNG